MQIYSLTRMRLLNHLNKGTGAAVIALSIGVVCFLFVMSVFKLVKSLEN